MTKSSIIGYIQTKVLKMHSVQKTGIYGTEGKFGAKKRLLVYGGDIRYRREPSSAPDAASKARNSLLLHRTHLQCAERPPRGGEQT